MPDRKSSLGSFLEQLNAEKLNGWLTEINKNRQITHDRVALPKFKVTYGKINLRNHLIEIGMERAFNQRQAESKKRMFEEIQSRQKMYISKVLHKAVVDVSEKGTEAAAVTAVRMKLSDSADLSPTIQFVADRPFFYVIRDRKTGVILFMGTLINPAA